MMYINIIFKSRWSYIYSCWSVKKNWNALRFYGMWDQIHTGKCRWANMRLYFEPWEIVRHVHNNKFNIEITAFKFDSKYRSCALFVHFVRNALKFVSIILEITILDKQIRFEIRLVTQLVTKLQACHRIRRYINMLRKRPHCFSPSVRCNQSNPSIKVHWNT
jgi:hypothetical protein